MRLNFSVGLDSVSHLWFSTDLNHKITFSQIQKEDSIVVTSFTLKGGNCVVLSDSAEAKCTLHFPESQNQKQTLKISKINIALDRKLEQRDVNQMLTSSIKCCFQGILRRCFGSRLDWEQVYLVKTKRNKKKTKKLSFNWLLWQTVWSWLWVENPKINQSEQLTAARFKREKKPRYKNTTVQSAHTED